MVITLVSRLVGITDPNKDVSPGNFVPEVRLIATTFSTDSSTPLEVSIFAMLCSAESVEYLAKIISHYSKHYLFRLIYN